MKPERVLRFLFNVQNMFTDSRQDLCYTELCASEFELMEKGIEDVESEWFITMMQGFKD